MMFVDIFHTITSIFCAVRVISSCRSADGNISHSSPCSFSVLHPLPSPLLRQYIISCLLNTWRQSQQGNYWEHSHVCTQPSLTHRTSFRAEKRPCCCKGRRKECSLDWWSAPDMSNMIQQMSLSLELIKAGICRCFFYQVWDLEQSQDLGWGRLIPYS